MRHMSFALTERQLLAGTKTVTRRLGWKHLRPHDRLLAVRKCMGLKRGETHEPLAVIEVLDVSRERLSTIRQAEVTREGFPSLSPTDFCRLFCNANRCEWDTMVTRIEFRVVDEEE